MNIVKLLAARYLLLMYGGVLLFIFFPLLIVFLVRILASLAGCPDGVRLSNDVCTNGDIFYALSQVGWLSVFTVPVGLILLGVLIFLNIVLFLLFKKRALVAGFVLNKIRKKIIK